MSWAASVRNPSKPNGAALDSFRSRAGPGPSPSLDRGSDGEQVGDEEEEVEYYEHEDGLQPEQPEGLAFLGVGGLERVALGVGDRLGVVETVMEGEVVPADEPPTAVRTHRSVVRRWLVRLFVGHGGFRAATPE